MAATFERARDRSTKLGAAYDQQRSKVRQLRDELRRAGTDTARLSDAQAELNRKVESAAAGLDGARAKSDAIAILRSTDADRLEKLSRVSLVAQGT